MKFTYSTGARPLDGYTIKRGIGSGGFGEVYYAVSDAGKEVALKRIQRHLDIELRGVSQCLNLKHPNLLSLFDIRYDDRGEAWVVMEYIVGESLRDVLERQPNGLPPAEVNRWFRGIAAGVAYLHDRGIVHRDLKPGNVFIDDTIVKIGDYGLSKFISCSRRSGQTESVGTFHYMAPEIGRGSYGKQIDIYALGVMLYELLTGKLPFDGETTQEIIMKHLTAEPDLSLVAPPYREAVRRALLKDPEKRFRSVGEMLQAMRLDAANEGGGFHVGRSAAAPVAAEAVYVGESGQSEIVFGPVKNAAPVRGDVPPPVVVPAVPVAAYAHRAPEEPIAHAVATAWKNLHSWWNDSSVSLGLRIVVLVGVVAALFFNWHWILPLALTAAFLYAIYFVIRSLVLIGSPAAPPPRQHVAPHVSPHLAPVAATAVAPAPPARVSPRKVRSRGVELLRESLGNRRWHDRVTEVIGALLMSSVVAAVLCFVALLLGEHEISLNVQSGTRFAWLLSTTLAGTWSLLVLGKLWETTSGDAVRRRFVMLVTGLGVGLVAWSIHSYLNVRDVQLVAQPELSLPGLDQRLLDTSAGEPLLPAYLLYFAAQFLLLRWWRQADALRVTRLSLWDTGLCVLAAYLVGWFIPFWSPWGMMLAATTSLSVQLSSSWLSPAQRAQAREQSLVSIG